MMINPSTRQVSPLSSGPTGASGNCYPSSSRFPNPVQAPSASPHERRPQNSSPFVPQSTVGRPSYMESQSAAFIDPMEDNKEISWGQDSLQDLLDFPVMEPIQSVPVEDSRLALAPVNHPEKSVWTEWDPLISIEGDLDQYWPDLPVTSSNGNAIVSKPEGITQSINAVAQQPPQNYQHQPAQSGEFSSGPDPSSAAAPTKSRMRWTQELHEAFVESVSKLGGCERATPKGILTLMKVSGLTIYHVKSHLQKYRTARFKPELSEGNSETKSTLYEEVKSEEVKTSIGITEALRLQVELQKRLHEQLETQRKLQLQIEEQGKFWTSKTSSSLSSCSSSSLTPYAPQVVLPYFKSKLNSMYNRVREARIQASLWGNEDEDDDREGFNGGSALAVPRGPSNAALSVRVRLSERIRKIVGVCYPWIHASNEDGYIF